jgi:peroxiredoxin Q/BCP
MNKLLGYDTLLKVGNPAPDFTLPDQHNQPVYLAEVLQRGWLILFFYPKDDSPVCTAQACAFRNAFDDIRAAGAEVIGISADSVESHQHFAEKQHLPFTLLSDPERKVAAQYGVPMSFGLLPGRVTFVIDPGGTIRMVYAAQFSAKGHMERALQLLREQAQPVP